MTAFLFFSKKNLLGILLTLFLFISLVVISFSVNKTRAPTSRAQTVGSSLDVAVNASNNDMLENSVGSKLVGYPWISLYNGGDWGGLRFQLPIPRGSVIKAAYLTVFVDSTSEGHPNLRVYGESSDNAADFGASNQVSSRAKTTASTLWTGTLSEGWAQSPSLVGPIQEVINRSGWSQGNNLVLILDALSGTFELRQWDVCACPCSGYPLSASYKCGSPGGTYAAKLHIDYEYTVTPPQPSKPPNPPRSNPQPVSSLKKLDLKVSIPFLLGDMKVNVGIDQYSKELTLKKDQTDYSIDTSDLNLAPNKVYTLTFSGDKILKKKVQFNASSAEVNVNAMELTLGDLNGDNIINAQDQQKLIDSISKQAPLGDLNFDGSTNSIDWSVILYNLGKVGD